jgi:hypothetical protein
MLFFFEGESSPIVNDNLGVSTWGFFAKAWRLKQELCVLLLGVSEDRYSLRS